MSALGWAVFEALDYGCTRDEHHALSPDLEQIIDLMTASGNKNFGLNSLIVFIFKYIFTHFLKNFKIY